MNQTPCYDAEKRAGAVFDSEFGWEVPAHFGSDLEEAAAARQSAAIFDLSGSVVLRVAGKDARDYLHRRLSNSVRKVEQGKGVYATLMGGDGRMISDLTVFALGAEEFLVLAPRAATELAEQLQKYVIMDDVEVQDLTTERAVLGGAGPESRRVFSAMGVEPAPAGQFEILSATISSSKCFIARTDSVGVPLYVIICPASDSNRIWEKIAREVQAAGGSPAGFLAWHVLRVEAGVPLFGLDMDRSTIPLEAGLDSAIDFDKGCFPGQEIVARINNLGHPAKKLVGLRLAQEDKPEAGAEIFWADKAIGRVTSSIFSARFGEALAIGYVRWDYRTPGTNVEIAKGDSRVPAVVTEIPFTTLTEKT